MNLKQAVIIMIEMLLIATALPLIAAVYLAAVAIM